MSISKELSEKEIILRLLAGATLFIEINKKNSAYLHVGRKGAIKIDDEIAIALVSGEYVTRINAEKNRKISKYTFNIKDRIRSVAKLSKDELNVFVMYMWDVGITISPVLHETHNDRIDFIFTIIRKSFYNWHKERKRYLDDLKDMLEDN